VTVTASPPPDVMPIFVSLPSLLSDSQQPVQSAPAPAVTEAGAGVKPPKKGPGVCVNGVGAGLTAGADAGVGLGAGAVGTASVGAGVSGTAGRAPDGGAFLSYGAAATTLRKSAGIPPQNQASPIIIGAAAGAGVGAYVTNASQTSQLGGPFITFGVDFGYLLNFSAQASFGSDSSGHPIFQVSGTVGAGAGAMVYVMTTNTKTAGIKTPCGG
jgi:hypothetical protein